MARVFVLGDRFSSRVVDWTGALGDSVELKDKYLCDIPLVVEF